MPKSQRRSQTSLSSKLERNLGTYAVAAGAAGMGLLALAQPAEAKVVYTPANLKIGTGLSIDLDHDSKADFNLGILSGENSYSQGFALAAYDPAFQNGVMATRDKRFARALPAGVQIGPKGRFTESFADLFEEIVKFGNSDSQTISWIGPWARSGKGIKNHYLGLKFQINGKSHFGWAKISTAPPFDGDVLKGYAYETVAHKPIVAGDKGAGASLGHLALGVAGRKQPLATGK